MGAKKNIFEWLYIYVPHLKIYSVAVLFAFNEAKGSNIKRELNQDEKLILSPRLWLKRRRVVTELSYTYVEDYNIGIYVYVVYTDPIESSFPAEDLPLLL